MKQVIEAALEIETDDGVVDGFDYRAANGQPLPAVLFLTDIMGIRQSQRDMAQRIAEQGYNVLLPNIFYRVAKPPVMDLPANFGDEKTGKRMRQLGASLTPEAAGKDADAYSNFIGARFAVVGLCFSGALAMRIAAAKTDRVYALASFHGGRLCTDDPNSPHLLLPRIKARLYFGHAENDRSMPAEMIERFNQALAQWGGCYESEVYPGAGHGWTVPDSPVYNKPQAERAFGKLMHLLSQQ